MLNIVKKFLTRNSIKKEKDDYEEKAIGLNNTNGNTSNVLAMEFQSENILDTNLKDSSIIDVIFIKDEINKKINEQVGRLELDLLEKRAWDKIMELGIKNGNVNKIRKKLVGITPLLNDGELSIALLANISKEQYISSACLQPFCNATEIMLYVSYVLMANKRELYEFTLIEIGDSKKKANLYEIIKGVPKETLESVLDDYRLYRNTIAHTYQLIPIEAAYSFIQRTYENIQRLELLIT